MELVFFFFIYRENRLAPTTYLFWHVDPDLNVIISHCVILSRKAHARLYINYRRVYSSHCCCRSAHGGGSGEDFYTGGRMEYAWRVECAS